MKIGRYNMDSLTTIIKRMMLPAGISFVTKCFKYPFIFHIFIHAGLVGYMKSFTKVTNTTSKDFIESFGYDCRVRS